MEKKPEKTPVEAHYDRMYSEVEHAFGGEKGQVEETVAKLTDFLKSGVVLELGAGQGRNSVWLAEHGFDVEAKDISSAGVDQIKKIAAEKQLNILATKGDAREKLEKSYDAIVSTYVVHHLTEHDALEIIEEIKNHIKSGGYAVLTAFTKEGDFYKQHPERDRFYPGVGELKSLFDGWEMLVYEETNTRARQNKEDGSPMFNISVKLIARKVQ